MKDLETRILEIARRRTVWGNKAEARQLDVEVAELRRALQRLRRHRLIYTSDKPLKNYYGSTSAGYRAT